MSDFLKISRNSQILEIVLDRPKANALDAPSSREMGKLFAEFRDDPRLRVAILTGAGEKFFSGGWDLNAVADGEEYIGDFGDGGFGGFSGGGGGGGGGYVPDPPPPPLELTYYLQTYDDYADIYIGVPGVEYQCGPDIVGVTGPNGAFDLIEGDWCTFYGLNETLALSINVNEFLLNVKYFIQSETLRIFFVDLW